MKIREGPEEMYKGFFPFLNIIFQIIIEKLTYFLLLYLTMTLNTQRDSLTFI